MSENVAFVQIVLFSRYLASSSGFGNVQKLLIHKPENKTAYKPLSWQLAFSICRLNIWNALFWGGIWKVFATPFVLRHCGDVQKGLLHSTGLREREGNGNRRNRSKLGVIVLGGAPSLGFSLSPAPPYQLPTDTCWFPISSPALFSLEGISFLLWCQFTINAHKGMTISVARPSGYEIFHHRVYGQELHQLPCFYGNRSYGDNSWLRWTVLRLIEDSLWGSANTSLYVDSCSQGAGDICLFSLLVYVSYLRRYLGNQMEVWSEH